MELLRKISRSTVYGNSADLLELVMSDKTKQFPLYRVFGYCNGSRGGESDYGNWTAMLGTFRAVNLTTKEEYASGVAFIPQFAADTVLGQLGGDVERVKFAFDITAEWDSESDRPNYKYGAIPLLEPAQDDPMEQFGSVLPALEDQSKGRKRLAGTIKAE